MDAWRAGFQSANPDVTVNYDPVGSGGGRTQFLDGSRRSSPARTRRSTRRSCAVGQGASAPPRPSTCPLYISPIAVVFNLEGVDRAQPVGRHHRGDLRRQDHHVGRPGDRRGEPRRDAPGHWRSRPCTARTSRAPRRTSPTTWPRPRVARGPYEADGDWPIAGGESGAGHLGRHPDGPGRPRAPSATPTTRRPATLGTVAHQGRRGVRRPVRPRLPPPRSTPPRATRSAPTHDIVIKIDRETTEAGAYPLVLVSYASRACSTTTQETADLVKGFLSYVASAEGQAAAEPRPPVPRRSRTRSAPTSRPRSTRSPRLPDATRWRPPHHRRWRARPRGRRARHRRTHDPRRARRREVTSTQSPPTPTRARRSRRRPCDARRTRVVDRGASRLFRWTATGAGALILVVLAAVAAFLVLAAWPALTTPAGGARRGGHPGSARPRRSLDFVGPLIFGTILAAALALRHRDADRRSGIALFISHYAPRRLASGLGYLVDLLAAIPSVVYGLWGAPGARPDGRADLGVAERVPRLHPALRRHGLADRRACS